MTRAALLPALLLALPLLALPSTAAAQGVPDCDPAIMLGVTLTSEEEGFDGVPPVATHEIVVKADFTGGYPSRVRVTPPQGVRQIATSGENTSLIAPNAASVPITVSWRQSRDPSDPYADPNDPAGPTRWSVPQSHRGQGPWRARYPCLQAGCVVLGRSASFRSAWPSKPRVAGSSPARGARRCRRHDKARATLARHEDFQARRFCRSRTRAGRARGSCDLARVDLRPGRHRFLLLRLGDRERRRGGPRRGAGARPRAGARGSPGFCQGPRRQAVQRDRPGLLPRGDRREDRRADAEPDRRADDRPQPDLRRCGGRCDQWLPLPARRGDADRQRGLVLRRRRPRRGRGARHETGAPSRAGRTRSTCIPRRRASCTWAGPTSRTSRRSRARRISTASSSTGRRSRARRRGTSGGTTRARP